MHVLLNKNSVFNKTIRALKMARSAAFHMQGLKFGLGFQQLVRDLANVNAIKPFLIITLM